MKNLFSLVLAAIIFITACTYEHEITDPCELHPTDNLNNILVGEWNMERVTDDPAVLNAPDNNELWSKMVIERQSLYLKADGQFEWGNDKGVWRTDNKAQTLTLDYSKANQPDHVLNIFGFSRCFFAYQDNAFFQGSYFLAVKD